MTLEKHIKLVWPNRTFTLVGDKIYTTDGGPVITNEDIENTYQQALDLFHKRTEFDELISQGFLVQPEGFILALGDADRSAFSQMLLLIMQAEQFGLLSGSSEQYITDINGEKRIVTTDRFKQIMVSYGFYFKTIWDTKH